MTQPHTPTAPKDARDRLGARDEAVARSQGHCGGEELAAQQRRIEAKIDAAGEKWLALADENDALRSRLQALRDWHALVAKENARLRAECQRLCGIVGALMDGDGRAG